MTIKELKKSIEAHEYNCPLLILVTDKKDTTSFLCSQYVTEILSQQKNSVIKIDDLQSVVAYKNNIFGLNNDFVYCRIDTFDFRSDTLLKYDRLLIICNKITADSEKLYKDNVIILPDLEDWHLKDYVSSRCSLSEEDVNYLLNKCHNIYRLSNEIDKICLFDKEFQNDVYKELCADNFLSDSIDYDIFSLANPIINKSYKELTNAWKDVKLFDSDPMLLLAVLMNQYKLLIDVFLNPNSTPEYCGVSQKRFNAVKYYNKNYSKKQLIEVYSFLVGLDKRLKLGELPNEDLLDFIIINVIQRSNL